MLEGLLAPLRIVGRQLEADLPSSIRRLIADRNSHAESANWSIQRDPRAFYAWLRCRRERSDRWLD